MSIAKNAFSYSNYTRARLYSLLTSPKLNANLHLVAVKDSQNCVDYCIGWEDEGIDGWGFIEPMGVHSDYRRLGLGKTLAKEWRTLHLP